MNPFKQTVKIRSGASMSDSPKKIMVVDDLSMNRELLRRVLERSGYAVVTAQDGQDAVEQARRERPALILMDLHMPGLGGVEAARAIKRDPETFAIPVVAVTAEVVGIAEEERKEMGFDDVLIKTGEIEPILAMTKRWAGDPA